MTRPSPARLNQGLGESGRVLHFRRRQRVVRPLRRRPLLRWLQPLLTAVAIVGLPLAAYAWLLTTPRLALQEIAVETGGRVPAAWIEEQIEPLRGRNLVALRLTLVSRRLTRHPWVAAANLYTELPHRLRVEVQERAPVALLREAESLVYLDGAGHTIEGFDPQRGPSDLLLVSRSTPGRGDPAAALAVADEIARVEPSWSAGLSEIEILGQQDFRIYTTALPFPLLMRGGTLQGKADRLRELLPPIRARYGAIAAVDLRFTRRIIVQPRALTQEIAS